MTEAETKSMADELAYVRSLAEEGATAPLIGGFYYLLWGGLMGVASLIAYAFSVGVISPGRFGYLSVWVIAGVIGWVASIAWGRSSAAKPGALTLGNKTARSVWFSVGIFMTLFWATLMFVHDDFSAYGIPNYFLFSLMFPVSFGVYGVAFFATATAAKLSWLRWFAFLAWGFAIVCMFLLGSKSLFLAGGAGCVLTAALPGALLMGREPADIV